MPRLVRRRAARALLLALACLLGLLGCADRGVLAPPTLEPLLVHVDGPWLRDAKNRVVLLRGVSFSALEQERDPALAREPREDDFRWLAGLGFNLIRLPVSWSAVSPRPDDFDHAYLPGKIDPLLRMSSNQGMQVVLAAHQVRWSSCFAGGHGAPDWACGQNVDAPRPETDVGWGRVDTAHEIRAARAQCAFFRGALAPDGRKLRDHYADAWTTLARYYNQDRRVFAFDLLNEPSAGGCVPAPSFTDGVLTPYYDELRRRIRTAGAPQALLFQPAIDRATPMLGAPGGLGGNAIFGPHLYTQTFGAPGEPGEPVPDETLDAAYDRAEEMARALGGPLLIGEVGGNGTPDGSFRPTTRNFLLASLDELDRRLVSGAVWAFVPQGEESLPALGGIGIGNESVASVLARPFARRIAGIPVEMRYHPLRRDFLFTFRDDPDASPPDPTEIFVPATRVYPFGFDVEVTAGDRWTFDQATQRLLVYRGSASTHLVRITPRLGGQPR